MKLRYHDLVVVPFRNRRPGIYWLRLYSGDHTHVAVVTEVPGNTSWPVSRGMGPIREWIIREHGVPSDQLDLFEVEPRGCGGRDDVRVTRVEPASDPRPASRAEIESLVGTPLPELPSHEELYAGVLRLGGGTMRTVYRVRFESIRTAELPPPEDLFRCPHHREFVRRKTASPELRRSWGIVRLRDLVTCPYHVANWKAVADESMRILRSVPPENQDACFDKAAQAKLPDADLRALSSLFTDPIRIVNGEYDAGQHRSCGLRFSGAAEVVFSPGEEEVGEELEDWTYRGEG